MAGKEPTTGCLEDLAAAFDVVQADLTKNILLVGASDLSHGAVNKVTWIWFRSAVEESAAREGVGVMAASDAAPR
jgi:hypothetical protein